MTKKIKAVIVMMMLSMSFTAYAESIKPGEVCPSSASSCTVRKPVPETERCKGTTKKGARCKNRGTHGGFCHRHVNQAPTPAK